MAEAPDLKRRSFMLGRFSTPVRTAEPSAAVITQNCFALQGIACMCCRDACASGALRFELAPGGARPWVEPDHCTACGECALACPAGAIQLSAHQEAS